MLDSNQTSIAVITLDSAVKKYDSYYPEVFVKDCKYIEKNVVRHLHDILSDFSYSSNKSDEEQIKAIWVIIFENIFFVVAILKDSYKE